MFSTLLGALPRPPVENGDDDAALRAAIEAQERLGFELLSRGGLGLAKGGVVEAWTGAASLTERPVKETLMGPYSRGRNADDPDRASADAAESLAEQLRELVAAGCPFIEIDEPDAVLISHDRAKRARFVAAHRRLTRDFSGAHLSLVIRGGNADTAGPATFFDLPYNSYAFDLIYGPDNWRLVTSTPVDRGIVCGALSPEPDGDETPEPLVWAVHYAASSRGLDRVGLANAPGLDRGSWDAAIAKLERVAKAAAIAALPSRDAQARALDPRAVDSRSAALGRYEPRPRRTRPGRRRPESA
jgi:methionine synthase II (cobalamin-independent)